MTEARGNTRSLLQGTNGLRTGVPGFEPRSLGGGCQGWWVGVSRGAGLQAGAWGGYAEQGGALSGPGQVPPSAGHEVPSLSLRVGKGSHMSFRSLLKLFLAEESTRSLPHVPLSFSRTSWRAGPPHPLG